MADFIYAGDGGAFKICTGCDKAISLRYFHKDTRKPGRLRAKCIICHARTYGGKTSWSSDEHGFFYKEDKPRIFHKKIETLADRREYVRLKMRLWRNANPDKEQKARASSIEYLKEWRQENKEHLKVYNREYASRRRRKSPKIRLEHAIRNGIYRGIKGGSKNGRGTFELLGYTVEELMLHLEKLFQSGMSWDNYGEWHIDHRIPLAAHNYRKPDDIDFEKAWSLENLRPMWAEDNIKKGQKVSGGFQPSLAFG